MNNAHTALQTYFEQVEQRVKAGNATEHSYRPALQDLLHAFTPGITATNEPKRVTCGAPDDVIERDGLTIGYVQAKDSDVPPDKIEKDEQLGRSRRALSHLALTDSLAFRQDVQGEGPLAEKKMTARLARRSGNKLTFDKEGAASVGELPTCFLQHRPAAITRPEDLADLRTSQKIVSALSETMTLMQRIDETIDEQGGWPIA